MPWVGAGFTYTTNIGYSNYNALESKYQRRFSKGLSTLISYTWSKSIDVSSGYFNVENGPGGGSTIQNYYDQSTAVEFRHTTFHTSSRGQPFMNCPPAKESAGSEVDQPPGCSVIGKPTSFCRLAPELPYNLQVTGDLANLRGSAPTRARHLPSTEPIAAIPS